MKKSGLWMRTLRIGMGAALAILGAACGNRDLVAPGHEPVELVVMLSGGSNTQHSSQLIWSAPTTVDLSYGLRIYRDEKVVATLTIDQIGAGWTETGLKPNTTYRYRVAVLRKDGTEALTSNTIFVTTLPAAMTIDITPEASNAYVGTPVQLIATVRDSVTGVVQPNSVVTWSSSDGAVATISSTGLFTAFAPGIVVVTASTEGAIEKKLMSVAPAPQAGAASVTVSPAVSTVDAGKTTQLSAIARDADGNSLTGTFAWSTSNPSVATVSQAGLVTTVAAGVVTIRATTDGVFGTAQITVLPSTNNDVASVTVAPHETSLLAGGSSLLTATVRNGQGTILTGKTITWTSENVGVATVSPSGIVTAVAVGSTVIVASTGGASGSGIITVSIVPSPAPEPVASITLTPASATISAGGAAQFTAVVKDASGAVLTGRTIAWLSSNPTVASVGQDGRVLGILAGTTTVTATSEGISATASVTVQTNAPPPAAVANLSVSPASSTLSIGSVVQLTAAARDVQGNVLTGRVVTWASSNPLVALVSPTGLVTALTSGSAMITATSEGQSANASITVSSVITPLPVNIVTISPQATSSAIGGTTQFVAVLKDMTGNVLVGRTVTWVSSDPTVATVSASGLALALKAGTATITATSEGKSGTAVLTVSPVPVALLTIAPAVLPLQIGETGTLTATARSVAGTILTGRTVVWASSNTAVATVSQTGVVTALSAGAVVISATSEGITALAAVTVALKPVATILVTPATLALTAGDVGTLTATTRDVDGLVVTGRIVVWTTSNAAVALVSPSGIVTAISAGSAMITATSEGKTDQSSVTVAALIKPIATFTVSPSTLSLTTLGTGDLVAVAKDADGVVLTGRPVLWVSSNPLVATVSPTGTVLALLPGTVTITATSEGKSAQATVTVTLPILPVNTVTVSPATLPLLVGANANLTATTKDINGAVVTGRIVTWSSSDNAIATVSVLGNVVAVSPGTATITATSEGKTGTATVTVSAVVLPVSTVTLSPGSLSLPVASTSQVTATTKDVNGAVLTGRAVVWTTSNPLVALVSQTGLVTGVTVGTATITATSEGVSASITATITPRPVHSVLLTSLTGFCAGTSLQLIASPRDSDGNLLTGRAVVWTTSNASIATVSPSGLLVGLTVGSVTVTATVEGVSASATISLCAPVVATVQVTAPTNLLSLLGLPLQLLATPRDANGNVILGRAVTWSVTPGKALISLGGLVTPLALGGITVTATIDGISATFNLTIGL